MSLTAHKVVLADHLHKQWEALEALYQTVKQEDQETVLAAITAQQDTLHKQIEQLNT